MKIKYWQEKDRLLMKPKEGNISAKFIYSRIDTILKFFFEHLPKSFLKGTAEEKKLIVTTMTKLIKFDIENLIVKLKDTFKCNLTLNTISK